MGLTTLGSAAGPWFVGQIFDARGDYFLAWLVIAIISAVTVALPLAIKPYRSATGAA